MATLRRDARALVDAVRASGSRVIKNFDADDDGVCVSMTLERGHTSNLTLIFEDGYPKGSFVAMSDDDRDDAAVATLNANVADRAPGSLVSLKDAVLSIGTVFGFEGDARKVVDACVDAPDDKDLKGAEGADTAVHASDTSTAGSEDEDLEEDEEAYAYSDDAPDDDSDVDVGDTAGPNDNTAVSGELNSDQLTRLYQNKRKCVEREERRVARKTQNEGGAGGSVETWDMKAAARNQIFSSRGAFARLSSELFALQERMDPELVVDAVDHDVYLWDVKFMGGFIPGSDLAEDLDTLDAVNGYRYIQIRLHFMADLYPFYPPRVTLVRPKLGGMVPGAMAAHPRLHLRNWQPFRPIKSVIEHLKAFLQKFARVDLASELNEIERFPEGAYVDDVSRLETSLARLAACGTSCGGPLIPSRYVDMYAAETAMEKESGATGGYEAEFEGGDVDDVVDFAKVLNEDAAGGAVGGAAGGSAVEDKGNKGDKGKMTGSLKTKAAGDPSTNAKGKGHKPEYWAKGTGYGHDVKGDGADGGAQTWDAAAAKGAQAAEDQSVLTLLVEATRFIRALPLAALAPGKSRTQVLSKASGNLLERLGMSDDDVPVLSDADAARAAECVRASCLPKFLARELKNCSFMNMTNRGPFYSSLMRAAAALAQSTVRDCLLVDDATGCVSELVKTFEDVARQAKIYLKSIDESEVAALTSAVSTSMPSPSARDKDTGATNTSNDDAGGIKSPTMAKPGGLSVAGGVGIKSPAMKNAAEENIVRRRRTQQESIASEISLARLILDVGESVSAAAKALNPKPAGDPAHAHANPGSTTTRSKAKGKGKGKGKGGKGGADDDGVVSEAEYQVAMTPFTYDSHENLSDGHAYAKEAAADLRNGPHISRVAKEIAGLAGGALPLNRSSSVFVRIDDAKSVVWSIMITGPEDTPYDGGCFIFDAFFPSGYPTHAPKIQFKTTGGGRWRANPNLYKDGKVCLSLLGTWAGGKGETWDPSVSTMLQVIVSVQSLILCPQPYFNEPGYERLIGTPNGKNQSDQYDASIIDNTLRWAMIEQLRKPHPAFKDAIKAHFKLRKSHLLTVVKKRWTEGATGERKARVDGLFKELTTELNKL